MILSTVDSRKLSVGLRLGKTWFNWSKSTEDAPVWEDVFSAASHLLALTKDATFPTVQEASIPGYAVMLAASMVIFANEQPTSTVSLPSNLYTGPWPGMFTLR